MNFQFSFTSIVFLNLNSKGFCYSTRVYHLYLQNKHETVDLNTDSSLQVDISDALSERDKVKFTVHTKVHLCKTEHFKFTWLTILLFRFWNLLNCYFELLFLYSLQTTLQEFRQSEFSVVRQHEEFVWLHDRYEENEEYAGIVVSYETI